MVSNVGWNSTKLTGFGYHRPCYRGHGVGRQIAGSIVNHAVRMFPFSNPIVFINESISSCVFVSILFNDV